MATEIAKEGSIRVRIDNELKEKFMAMCDNKEITMSKFIINAIENEIERYEFNLKNEKKIESRIEETEKKIQKLKDKLNV